MVRLAGRIGAGEAGEVGEVGVGLARPALLPVVDALAGLLPDGGLRRGSVVEVAGPAATSLALALVAEASGAGTWVAAVGMDDLGVVAAAELGVDLERLVLVANPGPQRWAAVVAALVDGLDVILVRPRHRVGAADSRRLRARARERSATVVVSGHSELSSDLVIRSAEPVWSGVEQGGGHLRARQVRVEVSGRGAASRPRRAVLWLPGPQGTVALASAAGSGGAASAAGSGGAVSAAGSGGAVSAAGSGGAASAAPAPVESPARPLQEAG